MVCKLLPALVVIAGLLGPANAAAAADPIFVLDFSADRSWMADSLAYGSDCAVEIAEAEGERALKITTEAEFSDAFLDLEALTGGPVDFTGGKYLVVRVLVPEESWVAALKLNFGDAQGNLGGIPEIANNFRERRGVWQTVLVDLGERNAEFQNWAGDESPLPRATRLSLNPFNANQAEPSSFYVSRLALYDAKPSGAFDDALVPHPTVATNNPFEVTFDDESYLWQNLAYRTFEGSFQTFREGVAGNATRAIRIKGSPPNEYIALLFELDQMTGAAVDFTAVRELYFDYYLVPGGDPIDGAKLFVTNDGWANILLDERAVETFEAGRWQQMVLRIEELDLELARGEEGVLPRVEQIRLDLNYRPGRKDVEMWIDNVGWR